MEYLFRNEDVIAYLRLGSFYDSERISLETAVRMQMRMYMDINSELLGGLLIAGENGLYASNELYRVTSDPLNEDGWYRRAVEAGGERVLISRPIGRNIRNYRNYSANDIVSVVRAVHDPESGALLGYAVLSTVLDEGSLDNIAVAPHARRQGIADALLSALTAFGREHLTCLMLEVRASNAPAIALYEKHGFAAVGRRKNYYDAPREDAVLMTLTFGPE